MGAEEGRGETKERPADVEKGKRVVWWWRRGSSSTSTPGGECSGMASTSSTSDGSLPERFKIDIDALKASVSRYFGRECTSCAKFAEGGFHSVRHHGPSFPPFAVHPDTYSRSDIPLEARYKHPLVV